MRLVAALVTVEILPVVARFPGRLGRNGFSDARAFSSVSSVEK